MIRANRQKEMFFGSDKRMDIYMLIESLSSYCPKNFEIITLSSLTVRITVNFYSYKLIQPWPCLNYNYVC